MKSKIAMLLSLIMVFSTISALSGITLTANEIVPTSAVQSSAAYANAPYFYGVTSIRVPTGTPVDVSRGMFRTMAHDVIDGDITHLITRTSPVNPIINTASAGTTAVQYSVQNSRGNTVTITVNVVVESRSNVLIQRRIHSRPNADTEATEIAGARRGNNHCGQHLGIYMPPNSNFRVRQVSTPTGGGNLTLRNFTAINGQNTSTNVTTNTSNWVTISHGNGVTGHGQTVTSMGRVPFINTPRNDNGHFTVELEFTLSGTGSVRGLNYFHHGDTNQTQFMSNWTNDHMFAVIASNTVNMVVPWNDRSMLTGQGPAHSTNIPMFSINEILTYTNELMAYMNDMHGFYIGAIEPYNRLIHTRYMVIPSFGGPGAAFYGGNYTGMSAADGRALSGGHTIYPYLAKSHLKAHEYAHGFDGSFSSRDYPLIDITTNVYVHWYRRNYAPQNRWWLYNYGNTPRATLESRTFAVANRTFIEGSDRFRHHLFMLTTMMDATGDAENVWRHMRQLDRRLMYTTGEVWSQADLIAYAAYEKAGVNLVPYMDWIGFNPTPQVRAAIFGSGTARMPYYLQRLAGTQAASVRTAEGIRGLWDTILPNPARNINATSTINISIDNINRIMGQPIRIMDGSTVVWQGNITGTTINVPNLPIGAYTIDAPRTTSGNFTVGYNWLTVRSGVTNSVTINYQRASNPVTEARVINMRGGSEVLFSVVSFDARNLRGVITTNPAAPHWVATLPNPYATITINGSPTLTRSWAPTTSNARQVQSTPVSLGNTITAFHAEGSGRGQLVNTVTGAVENFGSNNATFIFTEFGIFRQGTAVATQRAAYESTLNAYLAWLSNFIPPEYRHNPLSFADLRAEAKEAVDHLPGFVVPPQYNWIFSPETSTIVSTNPTSLTVELGATTTASVTVLNPSGTTTVSSSDTAVATATISNNTVTITGVSEGAATITVRNNNASANIAVTVRDSTRTVVSASPTFLTIPAGLTGSAAITVVNPSGATTAVSGNPAIATATISGNTVSITGVSEGDTFISVINNQVTARINVRITPSDSHMPPLITRDIPSTFERTAAAANLQVNATSPNSGVITFQWFRNDVAISGATSGLLMTTDTGEFFARITNTRDGISVSVDSTRCFVWTRNEHGEVPPTISISPRFATVAISRTTPLVADVLNPAGNTTWQSSNNAIATVSGSGNNAVVTGVSVGTVTITATNGIRRTTSEITVVENILLGDVNGDGVINNADVTMLRAYLASANANTFQTQNTSFNRANADVNGDGVLNSADVTLLRRHIANPLIQLG
jgi:uncharacterized protein YjdB